MPVTADTLRLHLDYTRWATQRLVPLAAKLSEEELTRDFKTSDKNVLETLVHVFAADRVWLARVQGNSPGPFISAEDRRLSTLEQEWPLLHQRWKEYFAPLTDQDVQARIAYRDLKGNSWGAAALANPVACSQPWHPPPRPSSWLLASHGPHPAAAGPDRVLSGEVKTVVRLFSSSSPGFVAAALRVYRLPSNV